MLCHVRVLEGSAEKSPGPTQLRFWLATLCSHNTAWNCTVLVKMPNYPQFSNKIWQNVHFKHPAPHALSHGVCYSPFLLESWGSTSKSFMAQGKLKWVTNPPGCWCRDAKRGQQWFGLPLHQNALVKASISKFPMNKQGINLAAGAKSAASRCVTCVRHRWVTARWERALAITLCCWSPG